MSGFSRTYTSGIDARHPAALDREREGDLTRSGRPQPRQLPIARRRVDPRLHLAAGVQANGVGGERAERPRAPLRSTPKSSFTKPRPTSGRYTAATKTAHAATRIAEKPNVLGTVTPSKKGADWRRTGWLLARRAPMLTYAPGGGVGPKAL